MGGNSAGRAPGVFRRERRAILVRYKRSSGFFKDLGGRGQATAIDPLVAGALRGRMWFDESSLRYSRFLNLISASGDTLYLHAVEVRTGWPRRSLTKP